MTTDSPYWIALAHLPQWRTHRLNSLIIGFHHERKISIDEFFALDETVWRTDFGMTDQEVVDLTGAKSQLVNHSFLAESMQSQGYEIIPIISPEYPKTLKENLKVDRSPAVCYVKGNKEILKENSVAIVGSRDASDLSLQFTDTIAKHASAENKVVVSGFAKGVDKQALDSALKYKGKSIIVLPQGIMTFGSGYQQYYKQIVEGDLLVISTFFPKAPWKAELAMARNPIIYGLANEIFVAESSDKGGTWSGVIDGLRKGRKIFVRMPGAGEKCANKLLIEKGAVPVDMDGIPLTENLSLEDQKPEKNLIEEQNDALSTMIKNLLISRRMTSQELITTLKLDWSTPQMTSLLNSIQGIEPVKVKRITYFKLKKSDDGKQEELVLL
ncbi:MAG: DNA-processing protein DprA [Bacteroidota bacterium]